MHLETEEETVNCEIIEEQHNIDVNQGITGFGNIDVECCENISEEDEKDFLQTWDEGTGENDSDIMLTSFSRTGWQSCGTMASERSYMSSVVVNNNIYTSITSINACFITFYTVSSKKSRATYNRPALELSNIILL